VPAPAARIIAGVSAAKGKGGKADRLDPYRKLRKPVPPPGRVLPDKRLRLREETAEREAREAERDAGPGAGPTGPGR
jgi:hypothetical protein